MSTGPQASLQLRQQQSQQSFSQSQHGMFSQISQNSHESDQVKFQFQFGNFGLRGSETQSYMKFTLFCILRNFHLFSELMIVREICTLRSFNFQLSNDRNQIGFKIYLDVKKVYRHMRY